jgi:hypothetical protein
MCPGRVRSCCSTCGKVSYTVLQYFTQIFTIVSFHDLTRMVGRSDILQDENLRQNSRFTLNKHRCNEKVKMLSI